MNDIYRALIGGVGGLLASMSKVLAMDVARLSAMLEHGAGAEIAELRVTLFVFTPILIIVGSVVAWATTESSRMKLLAIGVSAPALIAPWTTMNPTDVKQVAGMLNPVGIAHAGSGGAEKATYTRGLKVLLGLEGVEDTRYWVIVGSHEDMATAERQRDAINAANPALDAFVGKRKPDNPFYPVIVGGKGGYLPIAEAEALRSRAAQSKFVSGTPYLSEFPDRL